jgi:RHS repeat-associated protein
MTVDATGTVQGYDDYYPYGMQMTGRSMTSSEDGRYKFTGKERDASEGLDYFGARYYDGWKAGWDQVDPKMDKYRWMSPYNYTLDNPLIFFDPDGKEIRYIGTPQQISELKKYIAMVYKTSAGKEVIDRLNAKGSKDVNISFGKLKDPGKGKEMDGEYVPDLSIQRVKILNTGEIKDEVSLNKGDIILDKSKETFDPLGTTAHELRHADQFNEDAQYWYDTNKEEVSEIPPVPYEDKQAEQDAFWFQDIVKKQYKERK